MSKSLIIDNISVTLVDNGDKVQAVLRCLLTGNSYSIRELRSCANRIFSVSEKTVSRILKQLKQEGVVDYISKKWRLIDYKTAMRIVSTNDRGEATTIDNEVPIPIIIR